MSTPLGGGQSAGGYTHGAFGPLGCSWTASDVLENRTVHQNKITQCVYRVTDRITRRSSDLEYRVHARHGSQETLTHAWAAANRQPNANFAQHAVPGRCFVIFVDSCGPHAHRIGHPRPATTPQLIPFDNPHPCDVKKRLKHSHATDIELCTRVTSTPVQAWLTVARGNLFVVALEHCDTTRHTPPQLRRITLQPAWAWGSENAHTTRNCATPTKPRVRGRIAKRGGSGM